MSTFTWTPDTPGMQAVTIEATDARGVVATPVTVTPTALPAVSADLVLFTDLPGAIGSFDAFDMAEWGGVSMEVRSTGTPLAPFASPQVCDFNSSTDCLRSDLLRPFPMRAGVSYRMSFVASPGVADRMRLELGITTAGSPPRARADVTSISLHPAHTISFSPTTGGTTNITLSAGLLTPLTGAYAGLWRFEFTAVSTVSQDVWLRASSGSGTAGQTFVAYGAGAAIAEADVDAVPANGSLSVPRGYLLTTGTDVVTTFMGIAPTVGDGASYEAPAGWIATASAGADDISTGLRGSEILFVPRGAFDYLDPGEYELVTLTWAKTGNTGEPNTKFIRVDGPDGLGRDLLRGVTPGASMALPMTLPAGSICELQATVVGTGTVTPTIGGASGHTTTGAGPDSWTIVPTEAATVVTFALDGATLADVRLRLRLAVGASDVVVTDAENDGGTLTVAWNTAPVGGFPAPKVGYTELTGVDVYTSASYSFPFWQDPDGSAAVENTANVYMHDYDTTGRNGIAAMMGFDNVLVINAKYRGPAFVPATLSSGGNQRNVFWLSGKTGDLEELSPPADARLAPDSQLAMYGLYVNFGYGESLAGTVTNANTNWGAIDWDRGGRYDRAEALIFSNLWCEQGGESHFDVKSGCYLLGYTSLTTARHARIWGGVLTGAHWDLRSWAGINTDINISGVTGGMAMWRVRKLEADGVTSIRVRTLADLTISDGALPVNGNTDQCYIMHQPPAVPALGRFGVTHYEAQWSADGASWSPLALDRLGPDDCHGATRRTIAAPAGATHVRVRAVEGATAGAWSVRAVA